MFAARVTPTPRHKPKPPHPHRLGSLTPPGLSCPCGRGSAGVPHCAASRSLQPGRAPGPPAAPPLPPTRGSCWLAVRRGSPLSPLPCPLLTAWFVCSGVAFIGRACPVCCSSECSVACPPYCSQPACPKGSRCSRDCVFTSPRQPPSGVGAHTPETRRGCRWGRASARRRLSVCLLSGVRVSEVGALGPCQKSEPTCERFAWCGSFGDRSRSHTIRPQPAAPRGAQELPALSCPRPPRRQGLGCAGCTGRAPRQTRPLRPGSRALQRTGGPVVLAVPAPGPARLREQVCWRRVGQTPVGTRGQPSVLCDVHCFTGLGARVHGQVCAGPRPPDVCPGKPTARLWPALLALLLRGRCRRAVRVSASFSARGAPHAPRPTPPPGPEPF